MLYFLVLTTLLHAINGQVETNDAWGEKIVGGNVVNIEDYPYQARLENEKGLMCGASILSNHHLLTSSNCIYFVKEAFFVHTGSSYLSEGGTIHQVEANYTFGLKSNADIAVLRVTEPILFDKYRQPIELFSENEDPKGGTEAVVTGWGFTETEKVSNQLRAAKIPIVDRDECRKLYNSTLIGEITTAQVCAGYVATGRRDSCQGDGGGPLVIQGRQVGIVSKGWECGHRHFPGVYTSVGYYKDWILEQIQK